MEILSYLQQKSRYDVVSDTRYFWHHMMPAAVNGLNGIFKIQFFLKFDVFRSKSWSKVRFEQDFQKKVDFRFLLNPLTAEGF